MPPWSPPPPFRSVPWLSASQRSQPTRSPTSSPSPRDLRHVTDQLTQFYHVQQALHPTVVRLLAPEDLTHAANRPFEIFQERIRVVCQDQFWSVWRDSCRFQTNRTRWTQRLSTQKLVNVSKTSGPSLGFEEVGHPAPLSCGCSSHSP